MESAQDVAVSPGATIAEQFLHEISPWASAYRRAVVSYCAVSRQGQSHLVSARVELRTAEDRAFGIEAAKVLTKSLLLERFVFPIDSKLSDLVRQIVDSGQIPTRPNLHLHRNDGDLRRVLYKYRHPQMPAGARVPTAVVTAAGRSKILPFSDLEDLEWELKAASPPFLGISEALDAFGLPGLQSSDDWCHLLVSAESPAIIAQSSEIRDGLLHLFCYASKAIDPASIRIGLRLFEPAAPDSLPRLSRIAVDAPTWNIAELSEARVELQCQIPVTDTRIAQVFLSYFSVALHDAFVVDSNRSLNFRYTLHETFDKKLETLRLLVSESTQSASENFEHGLAFLLNLLGFSTALHGQAYKLRDISVDIIATTPSGRIALIECTTALPNHNSKLSNLIRRSAEAGQALAAHGIPLTIIPVLATALPRAVIESEIPNMERLGIAYATREDILEALNRVRFHTNPEQLYSEVETHVARARARRSETT